MKQANISTWQDGYVDHYPEFGKMADEQIKVFWPWDEHNVAKDKQDLLVNMTKAESAATVETLKLFTKYELFVGNEHWGSRISRAYPHVGPQRMSAAFAHVELNSHAPFYNAINKELGLDTMEFYTSYKDDEVLSKRMIFIDKLIANEDNEKSTAVFSLVEGAVLYSAFAFLKHFQSQGKNKLQTVVRGINMSVRDENLHALGGAALVNVALKEQERTDAETTEYKQFVHDAAYEIYLHECEIIAKLFQHGKIEGITATQMFRFVMSRINQCLTNLNLPILEKVEYNPIADYFYQGINNFQMNDIFQGVGREYERGWKKTRFVWPKKEA